MEFVALFHYPDDDPGEVELVGHTTDYKAMAEVAGAILRRRQLFESDPILKSMVRRGISLKETT